MNVSRALMIAMAIMAGSKVHASDINPGLLQGADGFVYGTASDGQGGTLFRVNRDGSGLSHLHDFTDPNLGTAPLAGLIEGRDGALYGTTSRGGDLSCLPPGGCGVVFRIDKDGGNYRVLHRFEAFPDGRYPDTAVAIEGNLLYGRVETGGDGAQDCNCGAIYQMHLDGTDYKLVHRYNYDSGEGVVNLAVGDRVLFHLTAH